MMLSGTQMIFLAFIAQVGAKELATNDVDTMVDNLIIKLSNRMSAVMQSETPAYHADLDNAVLGKPSQLAMRTVRSPPLRSPPLYAAVPTSSTRSSAPRMSRPIRQPEKGAEETVVQDDLGPMADSLTREDTWEAMGKASAAVAGESAPAADVPYALKFFVHGGKFGDLGNLGEANSQYMESRIVSALKNSADDIQSVDVRLNVEGSMTAHRTYRMEVTVNWTPYQSKKGTLVISNPKHAGETFVETVDHMHDVLKRELSKEKKKFVSKIRHEKRQYGENVDKEAAGEGMPVEEAETAADYADRMEQEDEKMWPAKR